MEYVTLSGEMRDSMNHYYIGCLRDRNLTAQKVNEENVEIFHVTTVAQL